MNRVFVGNLPRDIRIIDIDNFFRPFGKLVSIDVNHRANPVHAYVEFDNARNAFNAVKSRHGYDYEGYTLQLRLVENEARGRRDATPPPPPPPMFRGYENRNNVRGDNNDMRGNFSNSFQTNSAPLWPNGNRSGIEPLQQNMSQYSTSNRLGISQQNMNYSNNRSNQQQSMTPFSGRNGRLDMQQQYSNSNRPNMDQYSSLNRANNQQQFNNSNFSNQYANSNRSNMSLQNTNLNQSVDMFQNNMMNYSNNNRSNISQQQQSINMTNSSSNGSWVIGDSMGWNTGSNSGGNNNADNFAYGGYDTDSELSKFTTGLSGAGRRWFKRYLSKGFSPELARTKAIEHRTMPYLRDDPKSREIGNNPTNAALETIGNTIISLLSTNQPDNMGANFGMPGPSSTNKMAPQIPSDAISKKQYIKSLSVLKRLSAKSDLTHADKGCRRRHVKIVNDYKKQNPMVKPVTIPSSKKINEVVPIISTASDTTVGPEAQLWDQFIKKKDELLIEATTKILGKNKKSKGRSYKVRASKLINEAAISELDAGTLALHPLGTLRQLLSLKKEYDKVAFNTDFPEADEKTKQFACYQKDIKFMGMYENIRVSKLDQQRKDDLIKRVTRIEEYERKLGLPPTKSKFIHLLKKYCKLDQSTNKIVAENETIGAATNTVTKKIEKKGNEEMKSFKQEPQEKENGNRLGNQYNEEIAECDQTGNQKEFKDRKTAENENPNYDVKDYITSDMKKEYYKSYHILKALKHKSELTKEEIDTKNRLTKIVKDFKKFQRITPKPISSKNVQTDAKISWDSSGSELWNKLTKVKEQLLMEATRLSQVENKKPVQGYLRRKHMLINETAISEVEAKSLALHPFHKLKEFIYLKKAYLSSMKTQVITTDEKTKAVSDYLNDVKRIQMYENHMVSQLKKKVKDELMECVVRIYRYEKENRLPRTKRKIIRLLLKERDGLNPKKDVVGNNMKRAEVTTGEKEEEESYNENAESTNRNPQQIKEYEKDLRDNKDNENNSEDNQNTEDVIEDWYEENAEGTGVNLDNENITETEDVIDEDWYNINNSEDNQNTEDVIEEGVNRDNENITEKNEENEFDNENISEDNQENEDVIEDWCEENAEGSGANRDNENITEKN